MRKRQNRRGLHKNNRNLFPPCSAPEPSQQLLIHSNHALLQDSLQETPRPESPFPLSTAKRYPPPTHGTFPYPCGTSPTSPVLLLSSLPDLKHLSRTAASWRWAKDCTRWCFLLRLMFSRCSGSVCGECLLLAERGSHLQLERPVQLS